MTPEEEVVLVSTAMATAAAAESKPHHQDGASIRSFSLARESGELLNVKVCCDKNQQPTQVEMRRSDGPPCMVVGLVPPKSNDEWIQQAKFSTSANDKPSARELCDLLQKLRVDELLKNEAGIELSPRCLAGVLRAMSAENAAVGQHLPPGISTAGLEGASRDTLTGILRTIADANNGQLPLSVNSARFLPPAILNVFCKRLKHGGTGARTLLDFVQQNSEPLIDTHWGPSLKNESHRELRTPLLKWLKHACQTELGISSHGALSLIDVFRALESRKAPVDLVGWSDVLGLSRDEAEREFGVNKRILSIVYTPTGPWEKIRAASARLQSIFEQTGGVLRAGAKNTASLVMPKNMETDNPMYAVVDEFRLRLNRMGIRLEEYDEHRECFSAYSQFVSRLGKLDLPPEALNKAPDDDMRRRSKACFEAHAQARKAGHGRAALKSFLRLPFQIQADIVDRWSDTSTVKNATQKSLHRAHGLLVFKNTPSGHLTSYLTGLRQAFDAAQNNPAHFSQGLKTSIFKADSQWNARQAPPLQIALGNVPETGVLRGGAVGQDRTLRNNALKEALKGQDVANGSQIVRAASPLLEGISEAGPLEQIPHIDENARFLAGVRDAVGARFGTAMREQATAPLLDWIKQGEATMLNSAFNVPKETALRFVDARQFVDAAEVDLRRAGLLLAHGTLRPAQRAAFREFHRMAHAQRRDAHGLRWAEHLNIQLASNIEGQPALQDDFVSVGPHELHGTADDKLAADLLAQAEHSPLKLQQVRGNERVVAYQGRDPKTGDAVSIGLLLAGSSLRHMRLVRPGGASSLVTFEPRTTQLDVSVVVTQGAASTPLSLQFNAGQLRLASQDKAEEDAFRQGLSLLADSRNNNPAGVYVGQDDEGLHLYRFRVHSAERRRQADEDAPGAYTIDLSLRPDQTLARATVFTRELMVTGDVVREREA